MSIDVRKLAEEIEAVKEVWIGDEHFPNGVSISHQERLLLAAALRLAESCDEYEADDPSGTRYKNFDRDALRAFRAARGDK